MTTLQMLHELTPPLIWRMAKRLLRRNGASRHDSSHGSERDARYYDQIYSASAEYRKHYTQSQYYFLWCVIVDRMKPKQADFVLDVGCGPGQFAAYLRDRGLGRYVGLDFSGETIRLAKASCPEANFEQADIFQTDLLEKAPYNILVCTEFLEHIERDIRVLERVRSGTRVFGTVPSFPDPGHVRHFRTAAEVTDRYAQLFGSWTCDGFRAGPQGPTYFLFEGSRA